MPNKSFDIRMASPEEINEAMARGAHAAMREHNFEGRSILVGRGGKIAHIPEAEIVLFDEETSPNDQDNATDQPHILLRLARRHAPSTPHIYV